MKFLHAFRPRLLFLASALLLPSCKVLGPMSAQEKASTHKLYLKSTLDVEPQYLRFGATVFNNSNGKITEGNLLAGFTSAVRREVTKRGYTIVNSAAQADAILELEAGRLPLDPLQGMTGPSLIGAGVHAHKMPLFPSLVNTGTSMIFRLRDPQTNQVRHGTSVQDGKRIPTKDAPSQWSEFLPDERNLMLVELRAELDKTASAGLIKLGL
jgi:hypothetical protein